MERRRIEDRAPDVVVVIALGDEAASGNGSRVRVVEYDRVRGVRQDQRGTSEAPLLLLDAGVGDLFCVTGAELRRRPRPPGATLADLAAREAESMGRRHATSIRKQRFGEGFVVFVEQLARATTDTDVAEAVLHHGAALLGVYGVLLYLPSSIRPTNGVLHASADERIWVKLPPLSTSAVLPRPGPGPILRAETGPGQPFESLEPLFSELGASQLVCAPVGERGLLILIERRWDRDLGGEDAFRMQSVARQAERALERLDLLDRLG